MTIRGLAAGLLLLGVLGPATGNADSLPVTFQGNLPPGFRGMFVVRLAPDQPELLAVMNKYVITLHQLKARDWKPVSRIRIPDTAFAFTWEQTEPERPAVMEVGDVDADGRDEVILCLDELTLCYSWNGTDWVSSRHRLPLVPRQVVIGDLTGDGVNELVVAGIDSASDEWRYQVCVCRWTDSGPAVIWNDSTRLGYGEPNTPDFFGEIADYTNLEFNQLLVAGNQSDVSPTRYDLLRWNRDTRGLELVRQFTISESLVGELRGYRYPSPFALGDLTPYRHAGRTSYLADMSQPDGWEGDWDDLFRVEVQRIENDSLIRGPTLAGSNGGAGPRCIIDPDGKGKGIMTTVSVSGFPVRYRFYRLP